jgi:hypothetical protein
MGSPMRLENASCIRYSYLNSLYILVIYEKFLSLSYHTHYQYKLICVTSYLFSNFIKLIIYFIIIKVETLQVRFMC